eukprot:3453574-Rhodomonas_salina.4
MTVQTGRAVLACVDGGIEDVLQSWDARDALLLDHLNASEPRLELVSSRTAGEHHDALYLVRLPHRACLQPRRRAPVSQRAPTGQD